MDDGLNILQPSLSHWKEMPTRFGGVLAHKQRFDMRGMEAGRIDDCGDDYARYAEVTPALFLDVEKARERSRA